MTLILTRRNTRIPLARIESLICSLCFAALLSSTTLAQAVPNAPDAPADLVVVNATIWTGAGKPGDRANDPTALAVTGNSFVAVGTDEDIRHRIGPGTKVIDAAGRRVIPGMTDSHTHVIGGGMQLTRLNLRNVKDRTAFIKAVATESAKLPKGRWIQGGRWSVESWDDSSPPNKGWLDPVTLDRPTLLSRMDGHQALANSAALRLAEITATGPPDPPGGQIVRDPKTGEPTGILKEAAMGLVSRHIPAARFAQTSAALVRAMTHANSLGITSVHDMCGPNDVEVFRRASMKDQLTVRITAYLSVTDWVANIDMVADYGDKGDYFRLAGYKGYMDGSLGSRTAYMSERYADAAPDARYPRGQLNTMVDPFASFRAAVQQCDARRLQLAVHAIGDEAIHMMLGAYEAARKSNPASTGFHRIEHAQHIKPGDIERFAQLKVIASMQPYHKADDGRYAEKALGTHRLEGSYAFRQLVDAGTLVIFGSDWPVVTLNPFAGIDSAVNARTLDGKIWLASHSLSVEEALRAYTVWPAKAIGMSDQLGTIARNKFADFVILSDDPLTMSKEKLGEVKVMQTFVGGQSVYVHD